MRTKFIITNIAVLEHKYKAEFPIIQAAITRLIAADRGRGITSILFDVSDTTMMTGMAGARVKKAADPRQNKEAIDAIYASTAAAPDYVLLLGSIDVIPHQDLLNPLFDGSDGDDDDEHAWGDLPYACDAPYSQDISDFTQPTRVVGRVPDIQGKADSAYFEKLIDNAATWVSLKPNSYDNYFAISALTWQQSTKLSVRKTFGSNANVRISPTAAPPWAPPDLAPLAHFINCHGTRNRSAFFGEDPTKSGIARYPIAHQTIFVRGLIEPGTVASVECCYGAQLYKPSSTADPERGICQEYLHEDAYGFFGSTTIAYGPAAGNGAADIICVAFLRHVRAGDSLGLAALAARQDFIRTCNLMDPVDLKTLAQFNLLGDPSIHPVHAASTATEKTLMIAKSSRKSFAATRDAQPALDDGYRQRRQRLRVNARRLAYSAAMAATEVPDAMMDRRARDAAEADGIRVSSVKTFQVRPPLNDSNRRKTIAMEAAPATPAKICIVTGRSHDDVQAAGASRAVSKNNNRVQATPDPFVVVVMQEAVDGRMAIVRRLHSK